MGYRCPAVAKGGERGADSIHRTRDYLGSVETLRIEVLGK